jgi:Co/Zn/Cd efflux system component
MLVGVGNIAQPPEDARAASPVAAGDVFLADKRSDDRVRVLASTLCGDACPPNVLVLALSGTLFAAIATAQLVGALYSHSKALLADCVSMYGDVATYAMNIFVELHGKKPGHVALQCIVPPVSLFVLVFFTLSVVFEALQEEGENPFINGYTVLFFAIWGIVFDVISLRAFYIMTPNANMTSALAHVGADFARSLTTFFEAVLIIGFAFDGAFIDTVACLIVSDQP